MNHHELSTFLLNSGVDVAYFPPFAPALDAMDADAPVVAAWHPANAGNASARPSSSPWSPALLRGFLSSVASVGSMGSMAGNLALVKANKNHIKPIISKPNTKPNSWNWFMRPISGNFKNGLLSDYHISIH